jgi:hypothetical protein
VIVAAERSGFERPPAPPPEPLTPARIVANVVVAVACVVSVLLAARANDSGAIFALLHRRDFAAIKREFDLRPSPRLALLWHEAALAAARSASADRRIEAANNLLRPSVYAFLAPDETREAKRALAVLLRDTAATSYGWQVSVRALLAADQAAYQRTRKAPETLTAECDAAAARLEAEAEKP